MRDPENQNISSFLTAYPRFMHSLMHDYMPPQDTQKLNKSEIMTLIMLHMKFSHSPTQISKNMNMEKGSFSSVLANLIQKNLIIKEQDPEDKRRFNLSLTDEGSALITVHLNHMFSHLHEKLSVLTDEEYKAMNDAFKTIQTTHQILNKRIHS